MQQKLKILIWTLIYISVPKLEVFSKVPPCGVDPRAQPGTELVRATVLQDNQTIEALADGTFVYQKRLEVQVNDREAAQYYRTEYVRYDPETEILELKGSVFAKGDKKAIQSKKKHITDHASFDGFSIATDDRYKKLELDLPDHYPAVYTFFSTVKYIETVGLPAILWDHPEGVEVKSGSLTLIDPQGQLNYKVIDDAKLFTERVDSGQRTFVLKDPPTVKESQRRHLLSRGPAILLAPKAIQIEGTTGSFDTWPEMATWSASLLTAAGELPRSAIEEVRALVKDAQTEEERIALVYAFVQQRSHYVSIQLGIGGWKPMAPSDVHATGYGDCKALTNYTRLLLEAVGVKAAYCIIGVNDREIRYPKFASANQANHAMLAVPRVQDTIWLECTSQRTPPGYISTSASGRYALWVDKDAGQLVRTSSRTPSENTLTRSSKIVLTRDGAAKLSQKQWRRGNWLDLPLHLASETLRNQSRIIRRYFTHTLNDLNCSVNIPKGIINPEATINVQASMPTYAKRLGERLMLPVFSFQKRSTTLQQLVDAESYVSLDEVSVKRDTLFIVPPTGMRIIQLPEEKVFSTDFLDFSLSAKSVSGGVEVIRELILRKVELEGVQLAQAKEVAEAIEQVDHLVLGVVED